MRAVLPLLAVLVAAVAVAAPVPKAVKAKSIEDRIVGKWKMVGGDNGVSSGFYVVYAKGGAMEFRYEDGGGTARTVYPGKFKTTEPDGENKLGTIDWAVTQGGRERGEVSRILELTEDTLEFVDPQGVKERFERVKEKE
jgi:uncharacterized protein (TIGR03066 family)